MVANPSMVTGYWWLDGIMLAGLAVHDNPLAAITLVGGVCTVTGYVIYNCCSSSYEHLD